MYSRMEVCSAIDSALLTESGMDGSMGTSGNSTRNVSSMSMASRDEWCTLVGRKPTTRSFGLSRRTLAIVSKNETHAFNLASDWGPWSKAPMEDGALHVAADNFATHLPPSYQLTPQILLDVNVGTIQ